MTDSEISPALHDTIERVVRDELGRFGVHTVETIEAEDADGEDAILVLVHYTGSGGEPDPMVASKTVTILNDKLFEMKERRFAHLLHRVPDAIRQPRPRR